MRIKHGLVLVLSSLLLLSACNNVSSVDHPSTTSVYTPSTSDTSSTSSKSDEEEGIVIPTSLTIHYHMDVPEYSTKRFYFWAGGANGKEYEAQGVDDFGMYFTLNPQTDWPKHNTFNFIIKKVGTWSGQSTDTAIPYDVFKADENGVLEVYAIDGEGGAIEVYATEEETKGDRLTFAKFTSWNTIHCEGSGPAQEYFLYALSKEYYLTDPDLQYKMLPNYLIAHDYPNKASFDIDLTLIARPNITYMIKTIFSNYPDKIKTKNASFEPLYETSRFKTYYTYDGDDLGVTYTHEFSEFRVWAPTCARVVLKVYYGGTPSYLVEEGSAAMDWCMNYEMTYLDGGIYYAKVMDDLHTYYYTYLITNSEGTSEVCDPYARAAGLNGVRGEIVDLDSTDPEGWDEISSSWDNKEGYDIKSSNDLVVYEAHIRDLTMDESWGGPRELAGTYKGFVEPGTTYTGEVGGTSKTVKTGFDHLVDLGVNAVQLIPIFDQDNDERDVAFNWGYNPLNYNVPEGGYSSDPYNGEVAITELKELILALATSKNHIRVIMDVVFNHVSSVSSNNLNKLVPKYFFRIDENGYYHDGSGCGNEVKSEAPMMRKFIVDSVKYWASEYNIKGFRFDLMKLIDSVTMRAVKDAVYEIDHDNVCYGEGWAMGYAGSLPGTDTNEVYTNLYPSPSSPGILGGFNDAGRNAMRGGNDGGWGTGNPYPGWGFISQGPDYIGDTSSGVGAMMNGINSYCGGANPLQTVNYVSCHDNYTAFDQINYTLGPGGSNPNPESEPNPNDVCKASVAAHAAVMFSQGIAFIQGGEELFRSKVQIEELPESDQHYYPVKPYPDYPKESEDPTAIKCTDDVRMYGKVISHNSYRSSDEVNSFKYDRLLNIEYKGTKVNVEQYANRFKEMIKVRQENLPHHEYGSNNYTTWGHTVEGNRTWNGSTVVGYWANKNATNNKEICAFLGGRNTASTIAFDSYSGASVLFNSFGKDDTSYSYSGSFLTIKEFQFLVFRLA